MLHDRRRLAALADLALPAGQAEAEVLAAVQAVLREHPEYVAARDVVEHFRGHPEQVVLEAAAATLLAWDDDYDVEADFLGALASLAEQSARQQTDALSGKKLAEISADERARIVAALRARKRDPHKPDETGQ